MSLTHSHRQFAPRRLSRLLTRALTLHCPNCGSGGIFRSWFHLREHCPRCRLQLERGEPGYLVGSYMFNLIAAELVFAAIFLGVLIVMWPDPPWTLLQYGGAAFMVLAPIIFYPFSRTVFLAFDLVFRPGEREC